jgi:hypothetical protein
MVQRLGIAATAGDECARDHRSLRNSVHLAVGTTKGRKQQKATL